MSTARLSFFWSALISACIGAVSCDHTKPLIPYFSLPPQSTLIDASDTVALDTVLESELTNICVRFEPNTPCESVMESMQRIALHKSYFYFCLDSGEALYFGFPLTDLNQQHPWYRIPMVDGALPREYEDFICHNINIYASSYSCDDRLVTLEEIGGKMVGRGQKRAVAITMEHGSVYADLDKLLTILWNNEIYQYMFFSTVSEGSLVGAETNARPK